jgi:hypothetical protein
MGRLDGKVAAVSRILPSLSRATPSAVSERCSELIGRPISRSFTTSCVYLELRPLPSPGVTRLQRYYKPLRHPTAPSLSLAGVWLVIPDHALGLPVLRALSLCACCRHYPGAAAGRRPRSSHPAVTAFPDNVVGSACTSSFSRLAQRSLALRPAHSRRHLYVTCYTEGFSHFVTSMTAPVASGWSVRRVGLSPAGKRRLLTAHTSSRHSGSPLDQTLLAKSRRAIDTGRDFELRCEFESLRPRGPSNDQLTLVHGPEPQLRLHGESRCLAPSSIP